MEHIKQYANSIVNQVSVRSSVLNPLLWLSGVSGIVFLLAAWVMPEHRGVLISFAAMPFVAAVIYYIYFAHTAPNRLQSEEFQTRQQELLLASKTNSSIPFSVDSQIEDHSPAFFSPQELEHPDVPLLVDKADPNREGE